MKTSTHYPLFILHWNRPAECLETIARFSKQSLSTAITVIDNNSQTKHIKELEDNLSKDVNLLKLSTNKGWGAAFNVVLSDWLARDDAEYCFIAAHDAQPGKQCLSKLIHVLEENLRIGIAAPMYSDENTLPVFSPLRGLRYPEIDHSLLSQSFVESPTPHGTLMAFRKACLSEIGLFDEDFFAYGDEFDLGLRAGKKDWKVALVPEARVTNPDSWTPGEIKTYLFARNSLLLSEKHGGKLTALLRALLMLTNALRLTLLPALRKNAYYDSNFLSLRLQAVYDYIRGHRGAPKGL